MKQTVKLLTMIFAIGSLTVFMSCGGSDDGIKIDPNLEIEFDATSATVVESGSPITATISFPAAPAAISITANVTGTAVYDTDYTSSPAVSSGTVTLNVAAGATSGTITFTPIDNDDLDGSRTVILTLAAATGIDLGTNTTFTVTITDDETPKVTKTIAEIRALYDGSADVELTDDWYITGTVVSSNDATTSRNAAIQDATGGIVVRFDDDNTLAFGDEVEINVNTGTLSDFADLVQLLIANASATTLSTGNTVTPTPITITQMNTGDYESQYVQIDNVTFPGADGNATVSGNNDINDGADGVLRVESYAPFSSELEPYGTGSVYGVVSVFNGTAQVIPQESAGIFANSPTSTISVTSNGTNDFGQVETGQASFSQNYLVELTGTATSVTVMASSGFEVSTNNQSFSSSATIDFGIVRTASPPANLYARFAPNSGVAGAQNGTLTFTASGALATEVSVSGEETVAVPPIFSEGFETDGAGSRYTLSFTEGNDGPNDHIGRTDGTNPVAYGGVFTNQSGVYYAAQDTDDTGVAVPADVPATMTFSGIDITGKTNLQFAISVAEDEAGDGSEDWDDDSAFIVQYSIDGGDLINLFAVRAKALQESGAAETFNKKPLVDTDFDGVGDGTEITDAFAEFTSAISGAGTTLEIVISMQGFGAGDEDIAFDNIKVTGDDAP